MAEDVSEKLSEGKLDLVPMIDCIMLLLLFFILTSKFSSEEKAITSLLPTDKGQMASTPTTKVEPPKQINIAIWPAGFPANLQPADYEKRLTAAFKELQATRSELILPDATLRVGGNDPIVMQGKLLKVQGSKELQQHMDQIHAYVKSKLEAYEKADAASRKDQFPVVIHCFSSLSWKFALVTYDAVRQYEHDKGVKANLADAKAIAQQREVDFAPPRIRNYSTQELGSELYEIICLMK
jgi:biopolymer transport protein ExbD